MSPDGWMSDVVATRDEQPIRPTSTHPCITETAGIPRVNSMTVSILQDIQDISLHPEWMNLYDMIFQF